MENTNKTLYSDFFLNAFPGSRTLHIIMFVILLLTYLFTLAGNILIIIIVSTNHRLHSPMYIFLVYLSLLEICSVSTLIPKLLAILITNNKTISMAECFTQSYFYFFISSTDFLLLSVMSIDRYIAVCHPLRYSSIMKNRICIHLATGCLIATFLCLLYPILLIPRLPYCEHRLDHYFCDNAAILKLVCVDVSLIKQAEIISSILILNGSLLITATSYVLIVSTAVRIRSDTGRQKTFSTCVSHFTMVCIVFGSAIYLEIRPPRDYSVERDKVVSLLSNVLAPLLNPFVYTLRNKKVKSCIRDFIKQVHILSE